MNLIKLQYNFILTKKVKLISAILILLTWVVLLLQSGLLENGSNLVYNREAMIISFLYDGFNIIKIVVVIFSMLLSIYVFYLNQYDVFLVPRKSRMKIILSKIGIVLILEVLFVVYLFLVYAIILGVLDSSINFGDLMVQMSNLINLSIYYSLCYITLIMIFSSIFIVVLPFIGYLCSNLSMDYGVSSNELDSSSKFLNIFFPDLLIYKREIYFVYGALFVFDISILLLALIIIKYKADDVVC